MAYYLVAYYLVAYYLVAYYLVAYYLVAYYQGSIQLHRPDPVAVRPALVPPPVATEVLG